MPESKKNPKVFISYSHDSEDHKDRVLALSDLLRADGIDCIIDQYETSPPEGWAIWMSNQIAEADFILVVCTETYERRFRGKEETEDGLGGIGKTQTAVEYAYQYRNEYDDVLWVKSDSREALISDYAALA